MNKFYRHKFKKSLGQNFLIDMNIRDKIIDRALLDNNTLVIEIGMGSGVLSSVIVKKCKNLLGYEIDKTLKTILNSELEEYSNVEIIYDDFLKCDIEADISKYKYDKLYVIANIPYYITTPIINKIIDSNVSVDKMFIMVQKELGDRICAKPGTKEYNSLSIFIDYYFDVTYDIEVSRNSFYPKPNVDSVVLEFYRKMCKYEVKNELVFFKLVRDSFIHKRKTLKNNLINYDLNKIEKILNKYDLDLTVRAEKLSILQFIDIANNIS